MKEEETVPFCHFSRVFVGTTLRDLKLSNEQQVLRNCKNIRNYHTLVLDSLNLIYFVEIYQSPSTVIKNMLMNLALTPVVDGNAL